MGNITDQIDEPRTLEIHGACHIYLRQSTTWPDCVAIVTDGEVLLEPHEIKQVIAFLQTFVSPDEAKKESSQ